MSLPSSGQITLNDFRSEMSQSNTSNYGFDGAFYGFQYPAFYPSIPWYSPINVHSDNADNFETNFPYWNIDAWYGYNNSAYYEASSTPRACYFNIQPSQYTASYATAMIIIHVGTSSGTIPIRISGSANDFSSAGITTASVWYGKPWSSNGTGSSFNSQLVFSTSSNQFPYNGLDITEYYSHTYNASYGEYLYCIIHNNPAQPAIVPCGTTIEYTGGQAYPSVGAKVVGTGVGSVSIEFDAQNVPDRFIVYWGDAPVIDTGYRGYGPAYNYGQYMRGDFNASLNGRVDPLTGLTYPNTSIPNTAPDGYPYVSATGQGTSSFQKTTDQPITTTTKVYAPMTGTAWSYKVGCPV